MLFICHLLEIKLSFDSFNAEFSYTITSFVESTCLPVAARISISVLQTLKRIGGRYPAISFFLSPRL